MWREKSIDSVDGLNYRIDMVNGNPYVFFDFDNVGKRTIVDVRFKVKGYDSLGVCVLVEGHESFKLAKRDLYVKPGDNSGIFRFPLPSSDICRIEVELVKVKFNPKHKRKSKPYNILIRDRKKDRRILTCYYIFGLSIIMACAIDFSVLVKRRTYSSPEGMQYLLNGQWRCEATSEEIYELTIDGNNFKAVDNEGNEKSGTVEWNPRRGTFKVLNQKFYIRRDGISIAQGKKIYWNTEKMHLQPMEIGFWELTHMW